MHRGDAARSGFTPDTLPPMLKPLWTYKSQHRPQSAWPRDARLIFDRAYRTVIANGTLFFGSSADGKIYALDAKTGEQKWEFFTDAPVRFAPVAWKDRVFAASDDGYLYSLAATDGELIDKWRGGPTDDRVLGNGHIVGRWPVRGGPVIADGVLYWAAGIWQSEGVFIHAMDPETGKVLWTNDSSGGITMPQPHGGAVAKSGVSAQGHLVVDGDALFVPTGRAVPACFDRATGKFRYYHLQKNTKRGGTPTTVAGPFVYNGGYAFRTDTGDLSGSIGAGAVAALPDGIVHGARGRVRGLKRVEKQGKDRKGNTTTTIEHVEQWSVKDVGSGADIVIAGNTIVSSGGNTVSAIDLETKEQVWSADVDGEAYSLAVADGRLYVSTDSGSIHCFSAEGTESAKVIEPVLAEAAYGENDRFAKAAEEILTTSGVRAGYCVDLGCGDGALAYELAKRSNLKIYAVDSDPNNVAVARKQLDDAGLYGNRVTVHLADPKATSYPKFFANLVVSGRSVIDGTESVPSKEIARLQRPYGGKQCLGKPGAMTASVRGDLPNAGSWSHLYSNAANTLSSADEVKGPLRALWYRDIDLDLPSRHGRGPSPLFHSGRIFCEGMDALIAVDAYNGRPLWEFKLPGILHAYSADHIVGTSQTGSNFCAAGESVYVREDGVCYRLDAETGEVLGKFNTPPRTDGKPGRWGYIACVDGILFGSVVNEEHIVRHAWKRADAQMKKLFTESMFLFAMDAHSGELLWRYDAKESIRNNAIAIGDGRVFVIDRARAIKDLLSKAPQRRGEKPKEPVPEHPTGELICLDARTGESVWSSKDDIFGTMVAFSEEFDMLLVSYQATRFRLPSEVGGRMAVFRASDGYRAWDKPIKYETRPLINGRVIYALGAARDLLTGDEQAFDFKKSYGCGQMSASKHLMLFRSATLGYFDLSRKAGTENFGGVRPGCWINALPAGGLVLLPDASAGCTCSYQNRSWVALQGSE